MIVCADDYGWSKDINAAIVDLASRGQISAVSVMAALPECTREAVAPLRTLANLVDVGLHLVFTDAAPLAAAGEVPALLGAGGSLPSFAHLLRRALRRGIPAPQAERETALQHARFVELFGAEPRFVDSHLHTHQFPGIAEGIIAWVMRLPDGQRPFVRNAHVPWNKAWRQRVAPFKNMGIGFYGRRIKGLLDRNGIPTNRGFAGIYDYRRYQRYAEYLRRFAGHMEDESGILMTHPGMTDDWRRAEYEALRAISAPGIPITRFPARAKVVSAATAFAQPAKENP